MELPLDYCHRDKSVVDAQGRKAKRKKKKKKKKIKKKKNTKEITSSSSSLSPPRSFLSGTTKEPPFEHVRLSCVCEGTRVNKLERGGPRDPVNTGG